jgi:hypothetical protein
VRDVAHTVRGHWQPTTYCNEAVTIPAMALSTALARTPQNIPDHTHIEELHSLYDKRSVLQAITSVPLPARKVLLLPAAHKLQQTIAS